MNFGQIWRDPRGRVGILAGGAFALLLVLWIALGATGTAPSWLPTPFDGGRSADATTVAGTPGDSAEMTSAPSGAGTGKDSNGAGAASGDSNTSGDGSSADDGAGDSSAGGGGSDTPTATPAASMTLKILWWNDTEAKAPTGFKIVVAPVDGGTDASVSWAPSDIAAKSATASLEGLPYGKKLTLTVYPDGVDGKRITVPITLTTDMVSNSENDAVHVAVSDTQVRVLGTPVENFDQSFDRF